MSSRPRSRSRSQSRDARQIARQKQRQQEAARSRQQADEVARYFTRSERLQYIAPAGLGRHGGCLLLRELDDDGAVARRLVVKYSLNEKEDDDLRNEYRWLQRMRGAEHIGQLIELAEASLELRSLEDAPRSENVDDGGGGGSGSGSGGNADNGGNADDGNELRRPTLALEVGGPQILGESLTTYLLLPITIHAVYISTVSCCRNTVWLLPAIPGLLRSTSYIYTCIHCKEVHLTYIFIVHRARHHA